MPTVLLDNRLSAMKPFLFFLFALLLTLPSVTAMAKSTKHQNRHPIFGLWYTQDRDGIIELYPCEDLVCGRFHWLQENTAQDPSLDTRNPDADQRNRPLCNLQFMGGFISNNNELFEDGWIYSPRHGAMFSATMKLLDANTLQLHGYMFLPAFGQSQVWQRTTTKAPTCKIPKVSK